MSEQTGYQGTQDVAAGACEFNAISFLCTQIVNRSNTATLVMIKKVTNAGGVSPVGMVDVQPLVMQVAGDGTTVPHATIYGIPYLRIQGGVNAVIIDPQVGDIGLAVFADHDISAVKVAKKISPPGSMRRFDMADGVYIGGLLNGAPTQYIQFNAGGINIVSPTAVTITSPSLTHNGVNIGSTHTHSGVQSGGSNTGVPT